jgi:ABC-2 type transport system permease protein
MFNLVLKDLLIQKKSLILSLIYGVLFTVTFKNISSTICPLVIVYMLLMSACAYDDKSKSDIMLNSLPIRRKNIVLAKYLSIFVYLIIGVGISAAVTIVLKTTGVSINMALFDSKNLIMCIISVMILSAVYFPINFKFGYVISKYIGIIFFVLIFTLSLVLNIKNNEIIKLMDNFNNQALWMQASATTCIMLIIWIGSIISSIKIYENKDL